MDEDGSPQTAAPSWRLSPHCFYCSVQLVPSTGPADRRDNIRTRDHMRPRTHGGSEHGYNSVAACLLCNTLKAAMAPDAYQRFAHEHVALYRRDLARLEAHLRHIDRNRMARAVARFIASVAQEK